MNKLDRQYQKALAASQRVEGKDAVSAKINKIRSDARKELKDLLKGKEPNEYKNDCPICTRSADAPFRVYDKRGHVVQGCVDAFHSGRLITPSESSRWHNTKEAKAIRRDMLNHLESLGRTKKKLK